MSAATAANLAGQTTPRTEVFLLSDEQILDIDPEPQDVEVAVPTRSVPSSSSAEPSSPSVGARPASPAANGADTPSGGANPSPTNGTAPGTPEPPAWLAAQMNDTWNGADARALWDRVQSSENEAAAYREVFAKPEDARALKTLYPGGVAQAQAAAERARLLEDIDRAYFGAQASTPEQARASRAQLAAMMLREDPAAFREMVYEGLRALEAAGGQTAPTNAPDIPRLAQAFRANQQSVNVAPPLPAHAGFRAASADPQPMPQTAGLNPSATFSGAIVEAQHAAHQFDSTSANQAQLAAYTAFERAANAELEKTVGGAIDRALHQALPNLSTADRSSASGAPNLEANSPLQARLSHAIREDVERALQGDRQLGEQVAQILSSRRLDETARAQVVRLINDRALQLVPSAAKRALNEWTQTTLAAHRSRTTRSAAAASRREVPAAAPVSRNLQARQNAMERGEPRPAPRSRVNYGKLSDEQILDM